MRLIHYSDKYLTRVRSKAHDSHRTGPYKTPGLWFSVEGDHDWKRWCEAEGFRLDQLKCATEIILKDDAKILRLRGAAAIDKFTADYGGQAAPDIFLRGINWPAVRAKYQGLIIAPYCWPRRLAPHTSWYYGWDCASGVIWDAKAIKELRPLTPTEPERQIEIDAAE